MTNDGTRAFAYDSENQLTNVTAAGKWRSDFVYDGLNRRRIARDCTWNGGAWIETNETHYIYDGNLAIQERDTNNNVLATYARGRDFSSGLQGAGGIGGLLARTDGNGSVFYHADGSGNITALLDNKQNIVARYLYDPFGNTLAMSGTMANSNRNRFSSKEFHANSGLYNFGFRYYQPNLQRWMNQDPIAENGGSDLFGYVGNNPINNIDLSGLIGNPVIGLGSAWNSDIAGPATQISGPGYFSQPWSPVEAGYMDLGDPSYMSWPSQFILSPPNWWGHPQCNRFVGNCISRCPNQPPPLVNGHYPTAQQWGDPTVKIPGFSSPHFTNPKPGDVVTTGGHVGIMGPDGYVEAPTWRPVTDLPLNNNRDFHPDVGRTPITLTPSPHSITQ